MLMIDIYMSTIENKCHLLTIADTDACIHTDTSKDTHRNTHTHTHIKTPSHTIYIIYPIRVTHRNHTHRDHTEITHIETHGIERGGAGVEYHFQEFNEPYAPS